MPNSPATRRAKRRRKKFIEGNNSWWDTMVWQVDMIAERAARMSTDPGHVLAWVDEHLQNVSELVYDAGGDVAALNIDESPGALDYFIELWEQEAGSVISPKRPNPAGWVTLHGPDEGATFPRVPEPLSAAKVERPREYAKAVRWWRRRVQGIEDEEDE